MTSVILQRVNPDDSTSNYDITLMAHS